MAGPTRRRRQTGARPPRRGHRGCNVLPGVERGEAAIFLERLLEGLDVTVDPLMVSDGRQPGWPRNPVALLELAGGATVRISRHRVVVLPATPAPMTARARAARAWLPARPPEAGSEPVVLVARGRIQATYQGIVGLFDHLREPLAESLAAADPLRRAFEDLLDEIASRRAGYRTMAEALLRRCLILLLRRLHDRNALQLSWLAPLQDARLGRVVTAMQDRPEHCFTLPVLAEVAGMSRSVFAARFTGTLGQPPIEFLKTLRLARAARLLLATDLPVKSVAARVGYSSRSSFTRAFVAAHGVGPMAFRAAARERRASA